MKATGDTVIQFSGLKCGRYEYEYMLDDTFFRAFENEELQCGKVYFKVVLEKQTRLMMFRFIFKGEIESVCDRCLGKMKVPVEGERTMCVKLMSDVEDKQEDEDVTLLPETSYQLDLAQWMYEYVVMAMPIQHVHAAADCDPDMLRRINDDRIEVQPDSVDPRWEALLKLNDKQ